MKLQSQVCSLEPAKQLKALGVKQESYFYWIANSTNTFRLSKPKAWKQNGRVEHVSAFSVAELLELIPHHIRVTAIDEQYNSFRFRFEKGIWCKEKNVDLNNLKMKEFYSANYYCDTTSEEMAWVYHPLTSHKSDENPANAIAAIFKSIAPIRTFNPRSR